MPPNPDRQARKAAKRIEMENDPNLKQWQNKIEGDVLSGSSKPPEMEAVKPRQMLPSWYARGGKVLNNKFWRK